MYSQVLVLLQMCPGKSCIALDKSLVHVNQRSWVHLMTKPASFMNQYEHRQG
jgi:hypothetical protein